MEAPIGKKSSKTTSKTSPWEPAQGDILGSIGTVRDVVGGNQGNLDSIAGDIRGFLPGLGQQAFGPNPMLDAGNQYATDVLGGKYLNGNQYLDGMIGQTANDVSDRVNSLFGKSGASLGTQHAGVLSRELANAENTMRYGNYATERQNQQGAASMLPGLASAQYAGVAPYLAAAQTAGQLPYAGIGALSPVIGLASGAGTTTQKQSGGSPLMGLLGAGLSGWASGGFSGLGSIFGGGGAGAGLALSDRSAKTDIEAIGDWDNRGDGLKRYRFRYKNDPSETVREGVMADEVQRLRPWAYVPNFMGDKAGVNYNMLGVSA